MHQRQGAVLTLSSYQGAKGRAPSAPAKWSLDATPRPPNPQFPALSNGLPSIRANSAPRSDTCTHRRWTLTTSGSPCRTRCPAVPGKGGPKRMGRVATGSKAQAVLGVMGPQGALSSSSHFQLLPTSTCLAARSPPSTALVLCVNWRGPTGGGGHARLASGPGTVRAPAGGETSLSLQNREAHQQFFCLLCRGGGRMERLRFRGCVLYLHA